MLMNYSLVFPIWEPPQKLRLVYNNENAKKIGLYTTFGYDSVRASKLLLFLCSLAVSFSPNWETSNVASRVLVEIALRITFSTVNGFSISRLNFGVHYVDLSRFICVAQVRSKRG